MRFNRTSGAFELDYIVNRAFSAPTVIFVPVQIHYPSGYCANVSGGSVVSKPGSELLLIKNGLATTVRVTITAGPCTAS